MITDLLNTRKLLAMLAVRRRLDDCMIDLDSIGYTDSANQLSVVADMLDKQIKLLETIIPAMSDV